MRVQSQHASTVKKRGQQKKKAATTGKGLRDKLPTMLYVPCPMISPAAFFFFFFLSFYFFRLHKQASHRPGRGKGSKRRRR